jgi:hypothetical protein
LGEAFKKSSFKGCRKSFRKPWMLFEFCHIGEYSLLYPKGQD